MIPITISDGPCGGETGRRSARQNAGLRRAATQPGLGGAGERKQDFGHAPRGPTHTILAGSKRSRQGVSDSAEPGVGNPYVGVAPRSNA